jgi:guanylate cyclase
MFRLRFGRLRAPSYFCDNESDNGLELHYRSKRRGFVHYTIGQLRSVAETFYKLDLQIEVLDQEVKFDTIHVSFKVDLSVVS